MAPVDGWAVLIHAGPTPGGVIEALDGGDNVVATHELSGVPRLFVDFPCEPVAPPPTSPPPPVPTGPPPAEPAAAEEAIRTAYARAFTAQVDRETLTPSTTVRVWGPRSTPRSRLSLRPP
jgi:hypothetical protein